MTLIKGTQISKTITQSNLLLDTPSTDNDAIRRVDFYTRTVNDQPLSDDVEITLTTLGIPNINNTSDANKPVSTAQLALINKRLSYGGLTQFTNDFDTNLTNFYLTEPLKEGLFKYDPTDTTSSADGAMVLVKSGKRYKRVTEFITPEMFGAKGDGITDDTTALVNAFALGESVFLQRDYKVTSFNNILGVAVVGNGRILKAITGGMQQLSSYADTNQHTFGQEYMYFVLNKLRTRNDSTNINIYWSGDSTTSGENVALEYRLPNLITSTANKEGLRNIIGINGGVSSSRIDQWLALLAGTYIPIAKDVWIIRHGINSPSAGTTVAQFLAYYETALTEIRADKDVTELSVILMTPNTVGDTPNGRDEKYFEQINQGIRTLARKWKCGFIDTYALWQDCRWAAGTLMDNPFGDGRPIHPEEEFNMLITSVIYDFLFPKVFVKKFGSSGITNLPSTERIVSSSDLPSSFSYGKSILRGFSGFPYDGFVEVTKNVDNGVMQINYPYKAVDQHKPPMVRYNINIGDTWGEWSSMGVSTPSSSLVLYASSVLPNSYPLGVSIIRAVSGFPHNGSVVTFRFSEQLTMQMNYPYNTNSLSFVPQVRYSDNANNWGPWISIGGNKVTLTGFNFPSIAAGDSWAFDIVVSWVTMAHTARFAIDVAIPDDLEIRTWVNANGNVRLIAKNTSGSPIDLASGTAYLVIE